MKSVIAITLALSVLIYLTGNTLMLMGTVFYPDAVTPTPQLFETLLQTQKEIVLFVLGILSGLLLGTGASRPQPGGPETPVPGFVTCPRCRNTFTDGRQSGESMIVCPVCHHEWQRS